MFCAALSAPVTMCTLASSRTPDMPIGIADALLAVDDELLRQHVQDLLVGGDGDRLGGVDHVLDVAVGDLLVADRRPRRGS